MLDISNKYFVYNEVNAEFQSFEVISVFKNPDSVNL